ncbi:hypothetical protein [Embleya sp. NBC_00896]|uniref:hypothetical protein n=1 Tax=Embleya sp. NBC_00896 TaxID=2975961 RepID=UPI00386B19F3|nr:hypothetical protein OG928_31790 [Embleya sp. NBC_00896]
MREFGRSGSDRPGDARIARGDLPYDEFEGEAPDAAPVPYRAPELAKPPEGAEVWEDGDPPEGAEVWEEGESPDVAPVANRAPELAKPPEGAEVSEADLAGVGFHAPPDKAPVAQRATDGAVPVEGVTGRADGLRSPAPPARDRSAPAIHTKTGPIPNDGVNISRSGPALDKRGRAAPDRGPSPAVAGRNPAGIAAVGVPSVQRSPSPINQTTHITHPRVTGMGSGLGLGKDLGKGRDHA